MIRNQPIQYGPLEEIRKMDSAVCMMPVALAVYPWWVIGRAVVGLSLLACIACTTASLHDRPDCAEEVMAEFKVRACRAQTERLQTWATPFEDRVWAIESARGLGYLLSQQLVATGEVVVEQSDFSIDGRIFIEWKLFSHVVLAKAVYSKFFYIHCSNI